MNFSDNYEQMLEITMKEDLKWLKEEFEMLFENNNDSYSKTEKGIAQGILENVKRKSQIYSNYELLNLYSSTIKNIEQAYSKLF